MMDKLEKFIHENRQQFDSEVPDLSIWSNIQEKLDEKPAPRVRWIRRLRVAAAVLALLFAGGAMGVYWSSSQNNVTALADVSPEYAEMQQYYDQQIQSKLAQLASYNQADAVVTDIDELDEIYRELQEELKNTPAGNREQVVQAMIENYKAKIDILEQVLQKLQLLDSTSPKSAGNEVSI
ncbi:MAG: hypothetical protein CMN32_11560 [Saprospirales bacterium]|nr:hypothetical protein [Saprospirales bacterium]